VVPAPNSLSGKITARAQPLQARTSKAPDKSIAVLPLVTLSNDP
jgi:hypothetical protein